MRIRHQIAILLAMTTFVTLLLGSGCPWLQPPTGGLEGFWETEAEVGTAVLRFNSSGILDAIGVLDDACEFQIGALINNATTELDGDSDVTITIPLGPVTAVFTGVLSEDENTLTGQLNQVIDIGDGGLTIIIPAGDHTLTRNNDILCSCVECPEGEVCVEGECVPEDGACTVDEDCADGEACVEGECVADDSPAATFPTSLHGTRIGKDTFYSAANGGFEAITGIPMTDLPCIQCHKNPLADGSEPSNDEYVPGCGDCHADPDNPSGPVADSVCSSCHGRQPAEANLYTDYHRDTLGFSCTDCHTTQDLHGDGNAYLSLLEDGAIDAACETCHPDDSLASNAFHNQHSGNIDCSSCHTQSVISCYSCHFESEAEGHVKRAFTQIRNFRMLVNYRGKVHTATYQSLTYDGQGFYVIAPYYAHTVSKDAVSGCGDCHNNAAVQEYNETGQIVMTTWTPDDQGGGTLTSAEGVIPIPEDFADALKFDLVEYTGDPSDPVAPGPANSSDWAPLPEDATITVQPMLYGEPLTPAQMADLSLNLGP